MPEVIAASPCRKRQYIGDEDEDTCKVNLESLNDDNEEGATNEEPSRPSDKEADVPAADAAQDSAIFKDEILRFYYKRIFPCQALQRWLSCSPNHASPEERTQYFRRREFSFILDSNGDEIFLRYQSFNSAEDLRDKLVAKCPSRMEIGAVFNKCPGERFASKAELVPVEKDLVFDIDMSDYDDVRRCCKGADVCGRCWPFMNLAIKVLQSILTEDFGFEHLLFVYSGRRGMHCWVSDPRAKALRNDARNSIADFLVVYKGSDTNSRKLAITNPLHPSIRRVYETVLLSGFEELLELQGYLDDETAWTNILAYIPDQELRGRVGQRWRDDKHLSPQLRWAQLKKTLDDEVAQAAKKNKARARQLSSVVWEIVLAHTYPRLDINVTKQLNHLLKSPFCIHPKTGRVCVPIDPDNCASFDPCAVPTLQQIHAEWQQANAAAAADDTSDQQRRTAKGSEGTSLRDSVRFFQKHFLEPLETSLLRSRKDASEAAMEF